MEVTGGADQRDVCTYNRKLPEMIDRAQAVPPGGIEDIECQLCRIRQKRVSVGSFPLSYVYTTTQLLFPIHQRAAAIRLS